MHPLNRLINKNEKLVIGVISGTSMDGIDAALVRIHNNGLKTRLSLLNFQTFPYPDDLRDELLRVSQPGNGTVDEICRLNFVIGEYFADAALKICVLSNLDISQMDLIGSHGQTIHHLPHKETYFNKAIRATLQIGEPSVIANRTGVVTVANFRSADMAQDGQGAPLIPYLDYLLFRSTEYDRVLLNVGGIANITILKKNCRVSDVLAYDTGPGNMVINALMKKLYNKNYDEYGSIALSGKVNENLLTSLLKHTFFHKSIPKSTGREEFGDLFVNQILMLCNEFNLEKEDIIATVTELTTRSIAESIKYASLSIEQIDELIVSGGGVYNQALVNSLKNKFYHSKFLTTDDFNVPGNAKEAIGFAVLANETISGNAANLPSVTGSKRETLLGTICLV